MRFWAESKELYEKFRVRTVRDGLVTQRVFNDFMKWFIDRPREEKK